MALGQRLFRSANKVQRLEGLSDGVFSIALTLLIIDVVAAAKREDDARTLAQHLLHEWPVFMAYLVGFLTIFVCWVNHQRVFHYVTKADSGLAWINGLQLALVSAVPLPTALLAEHIEGEGRHTAVVMYGVCFFLMALSFWCIWGYAHRNGLTDRSRDPEHYDGMLRIYGWSVLWTITAIAVSMVSEYAALAMWALMFAVFAFPSEFSRRAGRNTSGEAAGSAQ